MTCQTCRISKGNMKIDRTRNLSLPPVETCKGLPCLNEGCYAMKAWRLYPSVQISWGDNWRSFNKNADAFFDAIIGKIKRMKKDKDFFRWHTGGEIPNQKYLNGMIRVALAHPKVKFLVFTKRYYLDFSEKPKNLEIVPSSWPGLKIPHKKIREQGFQVAWMDDGRDNRRIQRNAKNVYECPGSCSKCRVCWSASRFGKDIMFHKH